MNKKNTGTLICLGRINGMGEADGMGSYVKFQWTPDGGTPVEFVTNETIAQDVSDDINRAFHPY